MQSLRRALVFPAVLAVIAATSLSPSVAQELQFPKPPQPEISADFPFESRFVEVDGVPMHYVEIGTGRPILFLHGNPTSSYLWRNILPLVAGQGRVIAVDNVGFGRSGKPDIDYTFADHAEFLAGFIETLGLQDIVLVGHDWGGALAFDYAAATRPMFAVWRLWRPCCRPPCRYEILPTWGPWKGHSA